MLRDVLRRANPTQTIWDVGREIALANLAGSTAFDRDVEDLRGKSLIVLAGDQLTAALALIELDGVARRLVLCPPDIHAEQIEILIADSKADAIIVGPNAPTFAGAFGLPTINCGLPLAPWSAASDEDEIETEWTLLTSGTTGPPKMVAHRLRALCASFAAAASGDAPVWATFYDIRRYGGLQIFLRAVIGGGSLVLSHAGETAADHLHRLAEHAVTHISGTPSHWRRALMAPPDESFRPRYIRLSGEIADEAILDALRAQFPEATIGHAYASTEAGVAFEVRDGKAGFSAELVGASGGPVQMEVADGRLLIRSDRTASHYVGRNAPDLKDERGFVRSSDMVERRGDRYYFVGRGDGVVNVGGLKVHPEEVEAVINSHKDVRMSLVKGRRNPFTGQIVVADVVLRRPQDHVPGEGDGKLRDEIIEMCRGVLDAHKVPATIRFVEALEVSPGGKLVRYNA
jgi:acyl-coenzyme A synthetase/AMP-(fatty) acid ligase